MIYAEINVNWLSKYLKLSTQSHTSSIVCCKDQRGLEDSFHHPWANRLKRQQTDIV